MLEHPEITRALRTGYPHEVGICCAKCGQAADPEDTEYSRLYDWLGDYICGDCLRDEISDMDAMELASLLQLDFMEVSE